MLTFKMAKYAHSGTTGAPAAVTYNHVRTVQGTDAITVIIASKEMR